MATTIEHFVVPRVGTVAAYMTGGDVELLRQVRAIVGRVTVTGRTGLRAIAQLQRDGDLWGMDLDPACYLDRTSEAEGLFPFDWVGRQRDLELPVIRSRGGYVPRGNNEALRAAFADSLPAGHRSHR